MSRARCTVLSLLLIGFLTASLTPTTALSIDVLVPNGGERWTAGETREILWSSTVGGSAHIEWTRSQSADVWYTIEPEAPNTGSYFWSVPNVRTYRGQVRITELSTAESDTSDARFIIDPIPIDQSLGYLFLSADPSSYVSVIDVTPLVEFSWYLVTDIDLSQMPTLGGLSAWEASAEIPPELLVTQRSLMPAQSIDVGGGDNNWAVGTGTCIEPTDMPYALVLFRGLILTPAVDLELRLGPSSPSSVDPPEAPAWVNCSMPRGIWPFPNTAGLSINPTSATPVTTAERVTLRQNHPNPFNPRTAIRFELPDARRYELAIFDVRGRHLRSFEGLGARGPNEVVWDGLDLNRNPAGSGTYFYHLRAGDAVVTRKMVLTR